MNNEEVLRSLVEEIGRLREIIEVQNRSIEELREYIRGNVNTNDVASVATDEQITSVVDDVVNNNINQPRSIVASNTPRIDDNFMYGNDEANYYGALDRQIVSEALEQRENVQTEEDKSQDNVEYIPGTNIEKPRNRDYDETDEEYVKFLKDYYAEHFPNINKGIATINNNEPKALATIDSVKKPEIISNIENELNKDESDKYETINFSDVENLGNYDDSSQIGDVFDVKLKDIEKNIDSNSTEESRDIFSNSDGTLASRAEEFKKDREERKKTEKNDDKSEVMENLTEEDRKKLEGLQSTDYKKDENSKTKKIGKVRKALRSFKEVLKKHKKKIIAGVLVAATAVGAALIAKSCSYDNKEDLSENKDNPKSNTVNYDGTVPSVSVANSFEAEINKAFEKHGSGSKTDSEVKADEIVEEISQKKNENFNISDSTNNGDLRVGDPAEFTGDYLYTNSYNAENNIDPLTPYFPGSDNRKVSLVQYKGPNGETATAYNEEDQKVFEDSGWTPVAYNLENLDRDGLTHEGWVNPNDVIEVTVKSK